MRIAVDGGVVRLAALALALAGCGSRGDGPDAALVAYLAAVHGAHVAAAYQMMSTAYRKDHDAADFERSIKEHQGEVDATLARLAKAAPIVERHAEARYGDGDVLELVMEGGAWRIASDPIEFYPQSTPVEALRSFVRAVERKRYDVVMRFIPAQARRSVTLDQVRARWEGDKRAEIVEELTEVRAHLGDPFDVKGDTATLALGERRQAKLTREDGAWRIESLR